VFVLTEQAGRVHPFLARQGLFQSVCCLVTGVGRRKVLSTGHVSSTAACIRAMASGAAVEVTRAV
jgi:hypothetical protein